MAFATLGLAMAVIGFLLRGAVLLGDIAGMIDVPILLLLWETPPGDALMLRVLGLSAVLLGSYLGGQWLWVAVLGTAVAIWSFCAIGHVAIEELFWLQVVLFLHLFTAAFWIGVLPPLLRLSRSHERLVSAAGLGHRFGQVAVVSVPVLLLAGVIMTWQLVGSISAMFETSYGLTLLAKTAAVVVLLTLGAINKTRLVPSLQRGDEKAGPHLARSISLEWVCIGVILLATAVFTSILTVPS
ncbi:copper resistance D family protein [Roseobacter litoralis]|nr:CopD family protein [Roseobacter litoralis]